MPDLKIVYPSRQVRIAIKKSLSSFQNMSEEPFAYLAGPQVFTTYGREFIWEDMIPAVEEVGYKYIFPLELGDEEELQRISSKEISPERAEEYLEWNNDIGKSNQEAIDESDVVLANLDGSDVDSGTAAEIGYAANAGKIIIGYRTDIRRSGENEGGIINLQVEHFIRESGGSIIAPNHLGTESPDEAWKLYQNPEQMYDLIQQELEEAKEQF